MWRLLRALVLYGPILAMVAAVFWNLVDRSAVEGRLSDANGLIWGEGEEQVTVRVEHTSFGEQATHTITSVDNEGQSLDEWEFNIDEDMYGGGFIKACQADDDEELEVVAWSMHGGDDNFFLDYAEGLVTKHPFHMVSGEVRGLTGRWHQAHVMTPAGLIMLGFLVFVYYCFVAIMQFIVRFLTRFRKIKAEAP
jgi:hypothetical protein